MSVIFTFPGQGAQREGMLHTLPDHPEITRTLDETHAVLGEDPLELDSSGALKSTISVQLCLLIAGVGMARVLAAHAAHPDMVAGLSIGAWPAAVVAGVLDYRDAIRLVALRGHLMAQAYPHGYGMAALVGLSAPVVADLVARVHSSANPLYLANLNAESQTVVAGADAALAHVMALAVAKGATCARRLAMSVPSHCSLLDKPAARLAEAIAPVTLNTPKIHYLSSSSARILYRTEQIREDLAFNMARQVRWHDTIRHAYERGARVTVEMPGGTVLTRLTHTVFADGEALASDNSRLDVILARIARETRVCSH